MPRDPIPTWHFALVVVRLGHRFLLVQERKHAQLWYLPAGRVEPGETLAEGALRETLEESGVPVALDGILRVEHSPTVRGGARMRVVYLAHPVDDTPPKGQPYDETLGAAWFSLEQIRELPLRGGEVLELFEAVEAGAPVYPMSLVQREGAGWGRG